MFFIYKSSVNYNLIIKSIVEIEGNMKIETRNDLDNCALIIYYNEKEYNGLLKIDNRNMILTIYCRNRKDWIKFQNNMDTISATILDKTEQITIIGCLYTTSWVQKVSNTNNYVVKYKIDRIICDYILENINCKCIDSIDVCYDDTKWLTSKKLYDTDPFTDTIKINSYYKEYQLQNKKMSFSTASTYDLNDLQIKLTNNIVCSVKFDIAQSLKDATKYIYLIKNFLMLLSKMNVNISIQNITIDGNQYKLIDGYIEDIKRNFNNNLLEIQKKRIDFKIEKFLNLEEVLRNYENEYDKLGPFIELYYNANRCNIPFLTRFINSLTMLEYISREYDDNKAYNITKSKPKKKTKKEAEFVDRVYSLIENVNTIFNFNNNEIDIISKNIKDSRTYYIHYVNNGKKLDENLLFRYVYFIEDIVILNIYLVLGINLKEFKNISFMDFYYEKKDILN